MYIILNRDDLKKECKDKKISEITLFDFISHTTEKINFASHISFHEGDQFIPHQRPLHVPRGTKQNSLRFERSS